VAADDVAAGGTSNVVALVTAFKNADADVSPADA
jgi:hypothetical protein